MDAQAHPAIGVLVDQCVGFTNRQVMARTSSNSRRAVPARLTSTTHSLVNDPEVIMPGRPSPFPPPLLLPLILALQLTAVAAPPHGYPKPHIPCTD